MLLDAMDAELRADQAEMVALLAGCKSVRVRDELGSWPSPAGVKLSEDAVTADLSEMKALLRDLKSARIRHELQPWLAQVRQEGAASLDLAADLLEMEALLQDLRSVRVRSELQPWLARARKESTTPTDLAADFAEMDALLRDSKSARVYRELQSWMAQVRDLLCARSIPGSADAASQKKDTEKDSIGASVPRSKETEAAVSEQDPTSASAPRSEEAEAAVSEQDVDRMEREWLGPLANEVAYVRSMPEGDKRREASEKVALQVVSTLFPRKDAGDEDAE